MNRQDQATSNNPTNQRRPRQCSLCKGIGHDKRNCPNRDIQSQLSTPAASRHRTTTTPPPLCVDFESCVYCVFDLETTGFSRNYHDIIEICAILVDSNGLVPDMEVATFHSLVKPPTPISLLITGITGISNDTVATAPSFQEVGREFIKFLKDNCKISSSHQNLNDLAADGDKLVGSSSGDEDDDDDDASYNPVKQRDVVLVAHNGIRFDIPFLFKSFETFAIDVTGISFKGKLDTIDLVKCVVRGDPNTRAPDNYQLGTLYQYVTGSQLDDGHRSIADAKATVEILRSKRFWERRMDVCKAMTSVVMVTGSRTPSSSLETQEDSDTDGESDLDEDDIDEEEEYEDMNGTWKMNTPFVAPNIRERYLDVFTRATRGSSGRIQPGLKVAKTTVNSPNKAWSYFFTDSLLKKIVQYTNAYGEQKCSKWNDITMTDLKSFIAILFIASIQKRKDKTTNWWSNDPYVEFPLVKKIMSGKKFHTMLRYLHVCDLEKQPPIDSPTYSPLYKVQEMMDYLEHRFKMAFEAGDSLSLDESLIRAFGRIKFRVRIITKAARYGIKVYVLADAKTSFVLRVLVYTGQYTYNNSANNNEDTKKTIKVCTELCRPYKGSHRVVYVDRFYTSVELVKELERMQLYVTGTLMSNRIPEQFRISKRSREFKEMERGDHRVHVCEYKTDHGKESMMGLICWKDKDIVYCLTNASDTGPASHCYRRSTTGRVCIARPLAIGEYNSKMGGVDLADQTRLQCNSTIKGLHRWWLKLFFYQLDVGTSNAMVVYNEATGNSYNIAKFKKELVDVFIGDKIRNIPVQEEIEHSLVRGEARMKCVYCDNNNNNSLIIVLW